MEIRGAGLKAALGFWRRLAFDIDRSSLRRDRLAVNTLFDWPQTHTLFGI